ncbi:flavodoxin-dependent (E)-4-hydroxy-3-methylbut-2-enyl-diphosphate synthase [Vulgatibacter incomptus]|uniref:4-hydroxy-3-methylbut-2-en-1-yl diphosphate synthase (flavodoxin) n=1 Tax=Vulgatibacter incomptus TaxID=1391653 RepID=A0A0K1PD65_9BACT|nr:flavodoxin-dependent (E)-4-hydroxy-3-methylbut-2-enyl-diphosphate synthase [Vulgatibacter incomptus]AKU91341.1 1-hydroxy-2-methyl-2-(E)-butenyl 4-diphosphate synthase [Vulgatibacter incomptus]
MSGVGSESSKPLSERRASRPIRLGKLAVGGDAPVSVQSMATTDTRDRQATIDQCRMLQAAGCDAVRVAVPDDDAADNLGAIAKAVTIPVIADIHFNYHLALRAIEAGVAGVRVNPGNIGGQKRVREVARAAKERGIPIRIGVNGGSLEKELLERYGYPAPEAMVESAVRHIRMLEDEDFFDIKVSLKASDVPTMVRAYRLAAKTFDYALHLGVTEAGTLLQGSVKSAVGIGMLLAEGIGDTIRVSLTADPVEEVKVGIHLLKSLGLRDGGMTLVSCPTCGRCSVDMITATQRIEKALENVSEEVHVAVMGCEVNGPGEAREADVGIAYGHNNVGLLFKKGKVVRRFAADELEEALVAEVRSIVEERSGKLPIVNQ